MECPVCKNVTLVMSNRQDIEIDYCPSCRGVWLDRGELDKLIERSTEVMKQAVPQPVPQPVRQEQSRGQQYQDSGRPQSHAHSDQGKYKKKRGGFLGELFDFD